MQLVHLSVVGQLEADPPLLYAFMQPYLCALLCSSLKDEKRIIVDIGRDWRDRRGIVKEERNGFSTWRHQPAGGLSAR